MLRRAIIVLLLTASIATAAPRRKAAPKSMAPDHLQHDIAMFLKDLSADGSKSVVYKATAEGTRFFFEEPGGVTVYAFDGTGYTKTGFLKGYTLKRAVRKYK